MNTEQTSKNIFTYSVKYFEWQIVVTPVDKGNGNAWCFSNDFMHEFL